MGIGLTMGLKVEIFFMFFYLSVTQIILILWKITTRIFFFFTQRPLGKIISLPLEYSLFISGQQQRTPLLWRSY